MLRKMLAVFLSVVMTVAVVPVAAKDEGLFSDTNGHWAQAAVEQWAGKGLVNGYEGDFRPNDPISRAEVMVLADRIMGFQVAADNDFADLGLTWYTDAVLKCAYKGIVKGYDGKIYPEESITRQEAVVMLSRMLDLEAVEADTGYNDNKAIADWAKGYVQTFGELGYVQGRPGNIFDPEEDITRAEFVTVIDKMFAGWINTAGTVTGEFDGNVVINTADVSLENATVAGDLILAEGVGEGEVYLNNVHVLGDVMVFGGGENSVYFDDVTVDGSLYVAKEGGAIRIVASGDTNISVTQLASGAVLIEQELSGGGFQSVVIPAGDVTGATFQIEGSITSLSVGMEGAQVTLADGSSVGSMSVNAQDVNIIALGQVTTLTVADGITGTVVDGDPVAGGSVVDIGIPAVLSSSSSGSSSSSSDDSSTTTSSAIAVTGVELNLYSKTLTAGDTFTLVHTVSPDNASDQGVTWNSDDTDVATVSNGLVTAVSQGNASVNVTTNDGNYTTSCALIVNPAPVPVTGVSLNHTSKTLSINDTFTLTETIAPDDATNKGVSWQSSDTDVATVSDGLVTAVDSGSAVITVTSNDGSHTATCDVTVLLPIAMEGDGSSGNPFEVYSVEDLTLVGTGVYGDGNDYSLSANYILMRDLDIQGTWDSYDDYFGLDTRDINDYGDETETLRSALIVDEGKAFKPIGSAVSSGYFTGSFDGQGYTISNLRVYRENTDYVGLFGATKDAEISNLGLDSASISGYNHVGGFVGQGYSTSVTGCYIDDYSDVYSYYGSNVGGISGSLLGTGGNGSDMTKCYSQADIYGQTYVGGLIGTLAFDGSSINNCYATGDVESSQAGSAGGLAGMLGSASVNHSYTTGNVYTSVSYAGNYIGGLISQIDTGSLTNCIAFNKELDPGSSGTAYRVVGVETNSNTISNNYANEALPATGTVNQNGLDMTYEEFRSTSSYGTTGPAINLDWDLDSVWEIKDYAERPTLIGVGDDDGKIHEMMGSGTEADPYQVAFLEDLKFIGSGSGDGKDYDLDDYYILTRDLDFDQESSYEDPDSNKSSYTTGSGFSHIASSYYSQFTGQFDGNHHTISNLYISRSYVDKLGLFGYLDGAKIMDLGLIDADIRGGNIIGILAGKVSYLSEISGCYSTGSVTSTGNFVGGLIGQLDGGGVQPNYVSQCYSSATVVGYERVGGLIGTAYYYNTSITDSYATGDVTAYDDYAGGLIGGAQTAIINRCYATGTVTCEDSYVGGLVGDSYDIDISNSVAFNEAIVSNSVYVNSDQLTGDHSSNNTYSNNYANEALPRSSTDPDSMYGADMTQTQFGSSSSYDAVDVDSTPALNWDFTDVWEMGLQRPVLKNVGTDSGSL